MTTPLAQFSDQFATGLATGWVSSARGGGSISAGSGLCTIAAAVGTDNTLTSHLFSYLALPVGAGRDFYLTFTLNALTLTTSVNPSVFGVGTFSPTADVAASVPDANPAATLAPIIELGGTTSGSPSTYFSHLNENEVGRKLSLSGTPSSLAMTFRVLRVDNVLYAEWAVGFGGQGSTWHALDTTFPARTMIRRYENTESTAVEADYVAFYVRGSHPQDCAGVSAQISNVYMTSWDRWADPPTLGNLTARSWQDGGRIDLSWTNPPAGQDEVRSLTIARSTVAPPDIIPLDQQDEPTPYFEVDLTTPSPKYLPFNSTEWAARYAGVATPTTYYRLASDILLTGPFAFGTLSPAIGTGSLVNVTPASTTFAPAVGLNDGRMRLQGAPELVDVGTTNPPILRSSVTSADPSNSNHVTLWLMFRVARPATATSTLWSNVDASLTNGWRFSIATTGAITFTVYNGGAAVNVSLPSNYADGAWHAVMGVIDWSAYKAQAWGDLDGYQAGSTIAIISSVTGTMQLGAYKSNDESAHFQVCELAVWEGLAALNVREAQAKLLFTHGALPFTPPDTITASYARGSIAAGGWAFCENDPGAPTRIAKYGKSPSGYLPDQFYFGFHDLYEHSSRMDGAFDVGIVNQFAESENDSLVTYTLVNHTNQDPVDPQGLSTAVKITQTALNGRAFMNATGLSAGTTYTVSVYLKSNSGGHKVTVWLVDPGDTTTNINQKAVVYVQPYWRRYTFTVSTGAATGIGLRIYGGQDGVDTNKSVSFWGRMVHLGTRYHDYVPSYGTTGSRSQATLYLTATSVGAFVAPTRGEIRVQCRRAQNSIGAQGQIVLAQLQSGAVNNDSRWLTWSASDQVGFVVYDGAGTPQANLTGSVRAPGTCPVEIRGAWNAAAALTGAGTSHAKSFVEGVADAAGGAVNFTPSTGIDRLIIGSSTTGGSSALQGGVAFVRVYSANPACDGNTLLSGVGVDPLGGTSVLGDAYLTPSAAETWQDSTATQGRFYYYALFPSRAPTLAATFTRPMNRWTRLSLGPGVTDTGPSAAPGNRVAGLSLEDRVTADGKWFYNSFPKYYRDADEDDRKALGRATGLLDDLSTFMQRGLDQTRTLIKGMHQVLDAEIGPLGLIGTAKNTTVIADAFIRERGVNPDAAGLLGITRRRLWRGLVGVFKLKGTAAAVTSYVKLLTGWSSVSTSLPGLDYGMKFLRTWDGETVAQAISQAASGVTFAAGSFTCGALALSPSKFANGVYVDWFGNVKLIKDNTATQVTFADATFTPYAEKTFSATVSGGNAAQLPVSINDAQYIYGQIHETGLGAAVNITGAVSSTRTIQTAGGLTNGSAMAVAIAQSYTGNYAGRVPQFACTLFAGEHSHLYDPSADLTLRGTVNDPFFVLWPGLTPTGSGTSYPATDDDIIIWAPVGAARVANRKLLWVSSDGTRVVLTGTGPDIQPGDYLNPNRNQGQWFRVVGVRAHGPNTHVTVSLVDGVLSVADVATLGDLTTVIPRQVLEHDRAVRALVPGILPLNSRCFLYYSE